LHSCQSVRRPGTFFMYRAIYQTRAHTAIFEHLI
jgi:hypothetical protein